MPIWSSLMIAAPVAAGLLAAPAAHADRGDHRGWHGGGWHGGGWQRHDHDNGGAAAAAVLGLGAAAIVGGIIASQQQPYLRRPRRWYTHRRRLTTRAITPSIDRHALPSGQDRSTAGSVAIAISDGAAPCRFAPRHDTLTLAPLSHR